MAEAPRESEPAVKIKKYANRRLYNTATSTYVTLEDLAEMVKKGADFEVHDAKTGEDITRSVLTQIIFEQENKGQNLLPISFLRQLIRFYGDSMQALVPSYLEISLRQLSEEQDRLRRQMAEAMGTPFEMMEEQVRKNMAIFSEAMTMFSPLAKATEVTSPKPQKAGDADDIAALKDQLSAMQAQLDKLSRDRDK